MTTTPIAPATDAFEWTDIGATMLPEKYRDLFVQVLRGDADLDPDLFWTDGITWRAPNGTMPMSPGMSLQAVVNEYGFRRITAVSHNLAWEADDTTHEVPCRRPGYTATYTILGVRTRTQAFYFLDGGVSITPIVIERLVLPATLIEDDQ